VSLLPFSSSIMRAHAYAHTHTHAHARASRKHTLRVGTQAAAADATSNFLAPGGVLCTASVSGSNGAPSLAWVQRVTTHKVRCGGCSGHTQHVRRPLSTGRGPCCRALAPLWCFPRVWPHASPCKCLPMVAQSCSTCCGDAAQHDRGRAQVRPTTTRGCA